MLATSKTDLLKEWLRKEYLPCFRPEKLHKQGLMYLI